MRKRILSLLAIVLTLVSCDNKSGFRITGTIEGAEDSTLRLEANAIDGVKELASVKLDADGDFSFDAPAPASPEFYSLRIGDKRIYFSVDSTETITFKADYKTMTRDYTVEGSENAAKIKEIYLMQQRLQSDIIALEKNTSMYPGDIADSIGLMVRQYKEKMKSDYIFTAPDKPYSYYAVSQSITDLEGSFMLFNPLSDRDDVKCYAAVATSWQTLYPESERTKQICNMAIRGLGNTAQSQKRTVTVDGVNVSETGMIDIELPDINSNLRRLSDLKGHVVVLDFTKYAEKESAERTRIMRSIYDKYKDRGLEIYQVSLDDDVHFWKFSCENLPWVCVHETDGMAVSMYSVQQLPTFFIINREGEVVTRSEMMKRTMEDEIKSLL